MPQAAKALARKLLRLEARTLHWTEQLRDVGIELGAEVPIGAFQLLDAALDALDAPETRPYLYETFLDCLAQHKNDDEAIDRFLSYVEHERSRGWPGGPLAP